MQNNDERPFYNFLKKSFEKRTMERLMYQDFPNERQQSVSMALYQGQKAMIAHDYYSAKQIYFNILKETNEDPHIDELNLTESIMYSVKCSFCYCNVMDSTIVVQKEIEDFFRQMVKDLDKEFPQRMFPKYLRMVVHANEKEWFAAWHSVSNLELELSKSSTVAMWPLVDNCDVLAGEYDNILKYGKLVQERIFTRCLEILSVNFLLTANSKKKAGAFLPNVLKEKITSLFEKSNRPISEMEVHRFLHKNRFGCAVKLPNLCFYYNEEYTNFCEDCMMAKTQEMFLDMQARYIVNKEIYKGNDELIDKISKTYVQVVVNKPKSDTKNEILIKVKEIGDILSKNKNVEPPKKEQHKKQETVTMRTAAVQTDKPKSGNKSLQTNAVKCKTVEVQVNADSQFLGILSDMKTKILSSQDDKEVQLKNVTKKLNEISEKYYKEQKKSTLLEFEVQKLRDQLNESKQESKALTKKNSSLQRILSEQLNGKFTKEKEIYKRYEKESKFMLGYLSEIINFLTPTSVPNVVLIKRHMDIWNEQLNTVKKNSDLLTNFYKNVRSDLVKSDSFDVGNWPETSDFPYLSENVIFVTFLQAIKNIIDIEAKHSRNWNQYFSANMANQVPNPMHINIQPQGYMVGAVGATFTYPKIPAPILMPQQNFIPPVAIRHPRVPSRLDNSSPRVVQQGPKNGGMPPPNVDTRPPRNMTEPTNVGFFEFLQENNFREAQPTQSTSGASTSTATKVQKSNRENTKSPSKVQKNDASSSASGGPNKAYQNTEKILFQYITENCTGFSEQEVTLAMLKLMDDNHETLSDMSKETVLEKVKIILRNKRQSPWMAPKSLIVSWENDLDQNCTICFEDFNTITKYSLKCKHEFHKECILKWLKTKSDCPICRVHCVIKEEFPALN